MLDEDEHSHWLFAIKLVSGVGIVFTAVASTYICQTFSSKQPSSPGRKRAQEPVFQLAGGYQCSEGLNRYPVADVDSVRLRHSISFGGLSEAIAHQDDAHSGMEREHPLVYHQASLQLQLRKSDSFEQGHDVVSPRPFNGLNVRLVASHTRAYLDTPSTPQLFRSRSTGNAGHWYNPTEETIEDVQATDSVSTCGSGACHACGTSLPQPRSLSTCEVSTQTDFPRDPPSPRSRLCDWWFSSPPQVCASTQQVASPDSRKSNQSCPPSRVSTSPSTDGSSSAPSDTGSACAAVDRDLTPLSSFAIRSLHGRVSFEQPDDEDQLDAGSGPWSSDADVDTAPLFQVGTELEFCRRSQSESAMTFASSERPARQSLAHARSESERMDGPRVRGSEDPAAEVCSPSSYSSPDYLANWIPSSVINSVTNVPSMLMGRSGSADAGTPAATTAAFEPPSPLKARPRSPTGFSSSISSFTSWIPFLGEAPAAQDPAPAELHMSRPADDAPRTALSAFPLQFEWLPAGMDEGCGTALEADESGMLELPTEEDDCSSSTSVGDSAPWAYAARTQPLPHAGTFVFEDGGLEASDTPGTPAGVVERVPQGFLHQLAALVGEEVPSELLPERGPQPLGSGSLGASLLGPCTHADDRRAWVFERVLSESSGELGVEYVVERRLQRANLQTFRTTLRIQNADVRDVSTFMLQDQLVQSANSSVEALVRLPDPGEVQPEGDSSTTNAAIEAAAAEQGDAGFLYQRYRITPVGARHYASCRRVWQRPDGGTYMVSVACDSPHAQLLSGGAACVGDFRAGYVIRPGRCQETGARAVEIATVYFETLAGPACIATPLVQSQMWGVVSAFARSFREYERAKASAPEGEDVAHLAEQLRHSTGQKSSSRGGCGRRLLGVAVAAVVVLGARGARQGCRGRERWSALCNGKVR